MAYCWIGQFPATGLFNKPGLRTKFPGREWEAPYKFYVVPPLGDERNLIADRYESGEYVPRSALPEASAVYDAKCFARQKPLSRAQICYIAHEPLAEILSRFDCGPGGVVPYPIYEADEITPIAEKWFLLGLGEQKRSFLPEQSRNLHAIIEPQGTYPGLWRGLGTMDDDIACSRVALEGADLWAEPCFKWAFFYSAALRQALVDAGYRALFGLNRVRIV